TVLPGLVDCRTHLLEAGRVLERPTVAGLSTDAVAELIQTEARLRPSNDALVFRGWDRKLLPGPALEAVDRAAGRRPLILLRSDGRAARLNRRATAMLGLKNEEGTQAAPGTDGTVFLCDSIQSEAFRQLCCGEGLVEGAIAGALHRSGRALREAGITSVHDNPIDTRSFAIMQYALFGISASCGARGDDAAGHAGMLRARLSGDNFRVGRVGFSIDGTIHGHAAWLWDPYADRPDSCGSGRSSADIIRLIEPWLASARQLAFSVHGDRAVSELCSALEELERQYPWIPEHRFRLEGVELVRQRDLPRLARLGVVIVAQPACALDNSTYVERLGRRRAGRVHAHRSYLEHGIPLCFGSGLPYAPDISPLESVRALSLRESPQTLGMSDLLRAWTEGGAYAEFSEREKGILRPGKRADFVVVDLSRSAEAARTAPRVTMTVSEGRRVHLNLPISRPA
ncbi:amidohydrolase, partial [Salinispira pacifica]